MSNVGKLMFQVGIQEVDTKIADIKRAFDTFDEKYGKGINIKVKLDGAEDLINKLSAIGDPKMLKAYQDEIEKLKKQLSELKDAADKATSGGGSKEGNRVSNLDKLHKAVKDVDSAIESLSSKREAASGLGIDVSQLDAKIAKLKEYREELKRVESTVDLSKSGALRGLTFGGEQLLGSMNRSSYLVTAQNEVKALLAEFEKLIKAKQKLEESSSSGGRPGGSLASHMGEEVKRTSSEVDKLREKYERMMKSLTTSLDNLATNRRTGRGLGLNLPDISKIISQLRALYTTLNEGRMNGSPISTKMIEDTKLMIKVLEQLINTQQRSNATAIAQKNTSDTQQNTHAKQQNAEATRQQTLAEQSLAQALNHTSQSMMSQSSILSDLKSLATQYLGVWGGQQFLHNIIEIGGQLEMQRLSIGAILQNTAQANTLFEQIKNLAVKSPFGVVQLDQMTKQLTAYGFKYNELFDMTKRLADISAATGTDVSRLALALGHVRSEAALSGYTLRQFSMGNVPLLEKLAEKFGKTTAEIRKMVKVKAISYDDVKEVLMELTDEGGMFYNMQEVISQSVKAKFKNVKDAMDIMYGEMAEGGIGDALKGVAEMLMSMTVNWKKFATAFATGATVWGIHRVAVMAYTRAIGANAAATLRSISTYRQEMAVNLRRASIYRTLTAEEQRAIAVSQRYTLGERTRILFHKKLSMEQMRRIALAREQMIFDNALALSEKKLTVEDISRMVALGKLNKLEAERIIKLAGLSKAEYDAAMATIQHTRALTGLTGALTRAGMAVTSFGSKLKAILPMAGLIAIMEVWQNYTEGLERAKEIADGLYEKGAEGLKATKRMFEDTGIQVFKDSGLGNEYNDIAKEKLKMAFGEDPSEKVYFKIPEFDDTEARNSMDAWIQYIKDYSATPTQMINNAMTDQEGKVRSLKDQYYELAHAAETVARAQMKLKEVAPKVETALAGSGGMFDDDVVENLKQYEKEINKATGLAAKFFANERDTADEMLERAKQFNPAFAEAAKGIDTFEGQWMELFTNMEKYGGEQMRLEIEKLMSSGQYWDYTGMFGVISGANREDAMQDWIDTVLALKVQMAEALKDGSEEGKQAAITAYKAIEEASGVTSAKMKNFMRDAFEKAFQIKIEPNEELIDEKLPDWMQEIQDKLDKYNTKVKLKPEMTPSEVAEAMKKAHDDAQAVIDKLGGIKIGGKLAIDILPNIDIEKYKNMPFVYEALKQLKEQLNVQTGIDKTANEMGITLETKKKKADEKKNKEKSSSGSKEDKELKKWREQLDEINKFYSEYKKYYERFDDESRALAEMQKQSAFGSFFVNGKTIYDPNDMKKALDDLYNMTKGGTTERDKFRNEILQKRADFELDQMKEAADRAANEMKEYISRHGEEYDLYKKFFEKTGNADLSSMIFGDNRSWNNLARDYAGRLQDMMGDVAIDFGMSEEQAKKFFQGNDAAFELWKKIVDLTRKQYVTDMEKAVDAYAAIMTIEEKILKTEQELNTLRANGGSKYEIEAKQRELNKLNKQRFEESEGYLRFYAAPLTMGIDKLEEMAKIIKQNLIKQLADGTITAQQYTKAIRDVNNNLKKGREAFKSDAMTFLNGGVQGIVAKREDAFADAAVKYSQAQKELEKAEKAGDGLKIAAAKENLKLSSEQLNNAQQALSSASNFMNVLGGIYRLIQLISGTLHGLQEVAKSLSEMFDALGKEGAANTFSDIADGIGAVTSAIDPISDMFQNAMKGNISGIASSAISSPVKMIAGPITAIANLHDKKINRKIEKSVRLVKELENAYENMQNAIERRLTGIYGGDEFNKMLENYKDQLNELEYQRKKEADKKKNDKDKLADYDQQIKEMRDTIKYFAEDMAKDLYDIDVKSWAKELTDAVVDAWAKGEDAAEAWHDKVIDIVKDVTKNILAQKVVEAALAPVLDIITGEMYNKEGKLDETTIPRIVAAMEAAGEGAVSGLTAILDGLKQEGIDLSDAGKSSSSSSSIKSMTEETADLLLSYVNAIRGDVSVNRELQTKIAANIDLLPVMSVTAQAQLQQLTAISQNTLRNADMAEEIYVLFNGLKTGAWRLEVQ